MKKEGVPKYYVPYTNKCESCGKTHEIFNQRDDHPEYYTDVYVKCECGDFVLFKLPVN